jgi:hypothetical protein
VILPRGLDVRRRSGSGKSGRSTPRSCPGPLPDKLLDNPSSRRQVSCLRHERVGFGRPLDTLLRSLRLCAQLVLQIAVIAIEPALTVELACKVSAHLEHRLLPLLDPDNLDTTAQTTPHGRSAAFPGAASMHHHAPAACRWTVARSAPELRHQTAPRAALTGRLRRSRALSTRCIDEECSDCVRR